jgi:hypothetical protein
MPFAIPSYCSANAIRHTLVLCVLCACVNCSSHFSLKMYSFPYTPQRSVGGAPVVHLPEHYLEVSGPVDTPSTLCPRESTPVTHWMGGKVGTRASLHSVCFWRSGRLLAGAGDWSPDYSAHILGTGLTELSWHLISLHKRILYSVCSKNYIANFIPSCFAWKLQSEILYMWTWILFLFFFVRAHILSIKMNVALRYRL